MQVAWKEAENVPATPKLIGTRVFKDFPLQDVVPYIDWNPFFQARSNANTCSPIKLPCLGASWTVARAVRCCTDACGQHRSDER